MKKDILLIIVVFTMIALGGGGFLLYSIDHSTGHLNELVMLHQVELMRERLAFDILQVQKDLYSLDTTFPESSEAVANHLEHARISINGCFGCHHAESVNERLADMQGQIDDYAQTLLKTFARRSDGRAFRAARDQATIIGESLLAKTDTMLVLTAKKLEESTEASLEAVQNSRNIVILLVVAGPLMVTLFGITTARSFTKPINAMVGAVKRLRTGDLASRITGLKDEFAELANTFNDMAGSLQERLREIEENERRYRLLFESAGDAIFILATEGEAAGRIVAANPAAVAMHGYAMEELLAMRIQDLDAPEAAKDMPERMARLMKGEHIKAEISHIKKDGTVFPVEISAALFEAGNRRYVLAIDRDVTERRRVAETLRRTEQLRVTGELAAGLAHEIKNPLAGINVAMEALAEESYLREEDREILFKVIVEIKRIDGLVMGLLSFARPPRPHFTPMAINEVIESAAQVALRNVAPGNGDADLIQVRRSLALDLPEIIADPLQLKQVFMNLIMNAVDSMQGKGTLILGSALVPGICAIAVTISDTGRGMDTLEMKKIFQPFFTTKAKGTGLGLAISKRLVEEQGGRIEVVSGLGRGTTFTVVLPCDGRKGADRT